jgi:CspA family cold shock protein
LEVGKMGIEAPLINGRVVRYEASRGYGFIAPDHGGEDVFVHASELESADVPVSCGSRVRFRVVESIKGAKAYDVSAITNGEPVASLVVSTIAPPVANTVAPASTADSDDMCEIVSENQFLQEVTELILQAAPGVTGVQLVAIRKDLRDLAMKHGWLD